MTVKTYPVGTPVSDIESFDRSIKVIFECKEHKGIHYMSKQPSVSNWFPANEAARNIEFGITPDPCHHKARDYDMWVTAAPYTVDTDY